MGSRREPDHKSQAEGIAARFGDIGAEEWQGKALFVLAILAFVAAVYLFSTEVDRALALLAIVIGVVLVVLAFVWGMHAEARLKKAMEELERSLDQIALEHKVEQRKLPVDGE